ncbi:uncharacterized protein TNCV_3304041 [Trichonephila clavipes]|nr:uncharacterized protein TNCV_3304041 [Trichonephila clavipes]
MVNTIYKVDKWISDFEQNRWKSRIDALKPLRYQDLKSDTAFNEMLCDARELADEIDIPANFELTQPRHRVRRRNVNFDYERHEMIR